MTDPPTQIRKGAHRGRPDVGPDAGLPLLSVLSIAGVSLLIGLLLVIKTISGTPEAARAAGPQSTTSPSASPPSPRSSASAVVARTSKPRTSTTSRTSAPASTSSSPSTVTATPTSSAAQLPITVLNGSSRKGLAAKVATRLRQAGFRVTSVGNYRSGRVSVSTVFAPTGAEAQASQVAAALAGSPRVRPATGALSRSRITVIVTSDYAG